MDRYLIDVRSSLRLLRRSPGLTVGAAAALAMGIGFTTMMFSIVHGGTRPLPFEDADELVAVTRTLPRAGAGDLGARPFDYLQWSAQQRSFEGLAAFQTAGRNLGGEGGRPDRIGVAYVTPNTFELLGEAAAFGRPLHAADAAGGGERAIVLGHDLWTRRFGADPAVLGRTVRIDGAVHVVVGVMREGFAFPVRSDAWLPLAVEPAAPEEGASLRVFGRLREGVPLNTVRVEFDAIAARIAQAHPETHGRHGVRVLPYAETEMPQEIVRALWLMVGGVSFVLLIACANVANLLLARAAVRSREVAIRSALGASRGRIIGQHLLETLMLAAAGGLIGLGMAHAGVRFFAGSTAGIIEAFWMEFRVDAAVAAFATMLTVLAAVLSGVLPAVRASAAPVAETLKDRAGGVSGLRLGRLSRALVVTEVALASGLLVMALVFVKGAWALRSFELPFETRDVFTAQIAPTEEIRSDAARRDRLFDAVLERVRGLPGVTAAALAGSLPGRGADNLQFALDGPAADRVEDRPVTRVVAVSAGYLDVLGGRVVRGRDIGPGDAAAGSPIAVVNESFARRHSPDVDPIGRRIRLGPTDHTIVGVVPDLQISDIEDRRGDGVYVPLAQRPAGTVRIMARVRGDALAVTAAVRDAVAGIEPDVAISGVATLNEAILADKRVLDTFGLLFLIFGAGAMLLTMTGLYAVVSFAVNRRVREIGIRVALGAGRSDVFGMVMRQGMTQLGLGLAIGAGIAFPLSRAMAAAIEVIEPAGPALFALVFGGLAGTAAFALLAPARRAMAVAPVVALRSD